MTEHKRIAICSYKGGVGTSSFAANIASALTRLGRRCLLVDLSPTCRSLDCYLGVTERVIYDIGDVAEARVSLSDSIIKVGALYGLYVLPGVFSSHLPDSETIEMIARRAEDEFMLDTVIFDVRGTEMPLVAPFVTDTLVVTDESELSQASSARARLALYELGIDDEKLVINRFRMGEGEQSVLDMIDEVGIPLASLIPDGREVSLAQRTGKQIFDVYPDCACSCAYMNTARRLLGERVPLLSGIRGINRRRILKV